MRGERKRAERRQEHRRACGDRSTAHTGNDERGLEETTGDDRLLKEVLGDLSIPVGN